MRTPASPAVPGNTRDASDYINDVRQQEALLKTGALQSAIVNAGVRGRRRDDKITPADNSDPQELIERAISANFSSIANDAKGVIQIFNVGAARAHSARGRRSPESMRATRVRTGPAISRCSSRCSNT
jgi:hypothetical protein